MAKIDPNTVSVNPLQIEWPQDQYQITQKFKSEGLRLASRVDGHRDKLDVALGVLDVLRAHLIARYKSNVLRTEAILAEHAERSLVEAAAAEEQRLARIAALTTELGHLTAVDQPTLADVDAAVAPAEPTEPKPVAPTGPAEPAEPVAPVAKEK